MDLFEATVLASGLVMLAVGITCLFIPDRITAFHIKCLPRRLKRGKTTTPFQERIICRLAGTGFLVLATIFLRYIFTK